MHYLPSPEELHLSQGVPRCPKVSQGVPRCPKVSQGVPRCPKVPKGKVCLPSHSCPKADRMTRSIRAWSMKNMIKRSESSDGTRDALLSKSWS